MPNGLVPAPQVEPAWYGLLSVADVVNHTSRDEQWIGSGFGWAPEQCSYNVTLVDVCAPGDQETVVEATGPDVRVAPAFGIDVTDVCTTTFGMDAPGRRKRMQRAVETVTDKAVERALWSGFDVDGAGTEEPYPAFTKSGATVLAGGAAVSPLDGISLLEEAFASDLGYRGTVHASRRAGVYLAEKCRIEEQKLVTTKLGSKVVFGTGYELTGPGDAAPEAGTAWIFGTGPIAVHLGPVVIYETPEISRNDIINKAERPAAVVWDRCSLYAVRVTLSS